MYYAIMDVVKNVENCCFDSSKEGLLIYQFSAILVDSQLNIIKSFNKKTTFDNVGSVVKEFLRITISHDKNVAGVFFGQKTKKFIKNSVNMADISSNHRIFIYDSINLRCGFSKILNKNKLNFKSFFNSHNIYLNDNGLNSFINVQMILEVLRLYKNPTRILNQMILEEKDYQYQKKLKLIG